MITSSMSGLKAHLPAALPSLPFKCILPSILCLMACSATAPLAWSQDLPLTVADLKRTDAVDFNKEIMPILRQKCLACHHAKEAEAGLNLERFSTVVAGGDSGDGILAGEPESSLVFTRAAGIEEPLMPPEDNNVGAAPLTPQELGLLQLWIQQGAEGKDADNASLMNWDPIPESVRSVYALDISADGRFAAFGRGNRAIVIDLQDPQTPVKLSDPKLGEDPIAAIDIIQSIAFSPNADRIAVGGFRTVRIWERQFKDAPQSAAVLTRAHGPISFSKDQQRVAFVNAIGNVEIWDPGQIELLHTLSGFVDDVLAIHWSDDRSELSVAEVSGSLTSYNPESGAKTRGYSLNESIEAVQWTGNHSHVAILTGQETAKLYDISAAQNDTDAKPNQIAEQAFGLGDAIAIAISEKPATSLIVASREKGVHIAALDQLSTPTHIKTEPNISALTLAPDHTKLALGTTEGTVLIWNVAEQKMESTLQGTTDTQLMKTRLEWEHQGQNAVLAKLNGRTEGLNAALTKENEALKGATEAHKKAEQARTESLAAQKKAKEAADATTSLIATSQKKVTESEAVMQAAKSSLTELAAREEKDSKSLADAKAEHAKKTAAVDSTIAQIEALQKQLAVQRKAMEASAVTVAESQKQVEATRVEIEKQKTGISEAEKVIAEAKSVIESKTKELESQKKAVSDADAKVVQSNEEVAKRAQALAAATDAQKRAAAAIPAHKSLVDESTRMLQRIERNKVRADRLHQSASPIRFIAYNENGTSLAAKLQHGETRVYRLSDSREVATFNDRNDAPPMGTCWVGSILTTWYRHSPASIHNTDWNWQFVRQLGGIQEELFADRVTALAFDRTGRFLATGSGDPSRMGQIKLFDSTNGQLLKELPQIHSDSVLGLSFSPDNRILASAAADKTVRLTSVASGQVIRTLEGHAHHVLSVDWQEDGQRVMSASADKTVKIWDIESGRATRTITGFPQELSAIDVVQGTHQVVAAGINGNVRLANADDGKVLRNFDAGGEFTFTVRATPNGQWILAAGQSGKVRVWQLSDGKLVFEL